MAMTIENTPANCANDAIYFVVSSTNSGQSNFKYIADIYVGGNLKARLKVFPSPETGANEEGIFEVSRVVKDYLTTYFDPSDGYYFESFLSSSPNFHISVDYEMKFGEEYGGTAYYNQASGAYTAYNYYKPLFKGIQQNDNILLYDMKFLTDRDITAVETEFNTPMFISFFNGYAGTINEYIFTRYAEGWTSLGTDDSAVNNPNEFSMLNICPYAINEQLNTTFIQQSDYGYGVKIRYNSTFYSDEIKVKIKCTNPKGLTIPLTFLNRLGGYDTLNFNMVNRQRTQIEDKVYKRSQWRYSVNNMSNTTQAGYIPSSVKYYAKHTNTILLRSDYINEQDYNWIKDLIATTEAHISVKEINSYEWKFYPVIVKTLNWEEKKRSADKMFNVEIEIEVATEIYSQFL